MKCQHALPQRHAMVVFIYHQNGKESTRAAVIRIGSRRRIFNKDWKKTLFICCPTKHDAETRAYTWPSPLMETSTVKLVVFQFPNSLAMRDDKRGAMLTNPRLILLPFLSTTFSEAVVSCARVHVNRPLNDVIRTRLESASLSFMYENPTPKCPDVSAALLYYIMGRRKPQFTVIVFWLQGVNSTCCESSFFSFVVSKRFL